MLLSRVISFCIGAGLAPETQFTYMDKLSMDKLSHTQ